MRRDEERRERIMNKEMLSVRIGWDGMGWTYIRMSGIWYLVSSFLLLASSLLAFGPFSPSSSLFPLYRWSRRHDSRFAIHNSQLTGVQTWIGNGNGNAMKCTVLPSLLFSSLLPWLKLNDITPFLTFPFKEPYLHRVFYVLLRLLRWRYEGKEKVLGARLLFSGFCYFAFGFLG